MPSTFCSCFFFWLLKIKAKNEKKCRVFSFRYTSKQPRQDKFVRLLVKLAWRPNIPIFLSFRKTQPKLMKIHIAYGIKFIYYSGPDGAAEVAWNMFDDHNVNQFLENLAFFEKPMANLFHVFIFDKKYLFASRNSTSSFDEQDVPWIRLWKSTSEHDFFVLHSNW